MHPYARISGGCRLACSCAQGMSVPALSSAQPSGQVAEQVSRLEVCYAHCRAALHLPLQAIPVLLQGEVAVLAGSVDALASKAAAAQGRHDHPVDDVSQTHPEETRAPDVSLPQAVWTSCCVDPMPTYRFF